ncbi:MAG: substrate-binding domain-containing protein, partial [Pseudomonadota bacterium]
DNVVQPFVRQSMGLYATKGYVEAHGVPDTINKEMTGHRFVSHDNEDNRAPFHKWLRSNAPADAITFRSTDVRAMEQAVLSGAGIGFLPVLEARANPDLVEMQTPQEDWAAPLWLVTHVDLHRTNKVQAFLSFLKDASKSWQVI